MKEDLCRAFCDEIAVKEVPVGLAVSTPFRRSDGDAVAFYVIQNSTVPGLARLEDDGQTIAYLEACGVDFDTQTRRKALDALLSEHGAQIDHDENVIKTPNLKESELPRAALSFVGLLLRLFDFLLLTQDHVESTFKEDAAKSIRSVIGSRAEINEIDPVSDKLTEIIPDLVVRAPNRLPVAVFLSQSATRVHEAIFLQMSADYEAKEPLSVVALLEKEGTLSHNMHRRARNRLATVTSWEGDKEAAVKRIEKEVIGPAGMVH